MTIIPPGVHKSVLQDMMICSCLVVGVFFFFFKVYCSSSDISKRLLNLFFTLQTKTKFTYLLYPQMLCEFHQNCINRVFFLLSFCILFFWWEVLKNKSSSTHLSFSSFLFFLTPPPSFLTFVNSFYLHFWPKLLYIFLSVSVSPLSRMVPFGKIYSLVLSPSKFPIKPVTSPLNSSGTVAERVS